MNFEEIDQSIWTAYTFVDLLDQEELEEVYESVSMLLDAVPDAINELEDKKKLIEGGVR